MDLDGENFDMLEDVDMDVVDDSQLDASNMMLDLNETNNNDEEEDEEERIRKLNNPTPNNNSNENDDEDNDEDDDEDDEEGAYAERSTVVSGLDANEEVPDYQSIASSQQPRKVKRERTNAKAVECLDMDGNLIEVFRSGLAASTKLNIPQGDISLCCRGLKRSVAGYRFRFQGDLEDRTEFKLRRGYGYVLEPVTGDGKELVQSNTMNSTTTATRTTRASRGEYSILNAQQNAERVNNSSKENFKAIAEIKTRSWTQNMVDVGPFLIKKWIPNQPTPTAALQEIKPKLGDQKKTKTRTTRKSAGGGGYIRTRGNMNNMNNDNYDE